MFLNDTGTVLYMINKSNNFCYILSETNLKILHKLIYVYGCDVDSLITLSLRFAVASLIYYLKRT